MKSREQLLAPGSTDKTVATADLNIRSTISLDVYAGTRSWMWKVYLNKAELTSQSGYFTHAMASEAGLEEWNRIVSAVTGSNIKAIRTTVAAAEEEASE
ncbi:hypothetical protein [Imhoffiella purpurea]|uniref:Uncharacterized protein n=1 Tax=Imhoffiella purpurea TaxID=1249627 RepID=W9VJC3_9GAMM|nr:hypothetical protein [Imhoffiella purpurea]EXJ10665.1 hypothetical protein D779_0363 [Imhoffiella purpurea]